MSRAYVLGMAGELLSKVSSGPGEHSSHPYPSDGGARTLRDAAAGRGMSSRAGLSRKREEVTSAIAGVTRAVDGVRERMGRLRAPSPQWRQERETDLREAEQEAARAREVLAVPQQGKLKGMADTAVSDRESSAVTSAATRALAARDAIGRAEDRIRQAEESERRHNR